MRRVLVAAFCAGLLIFMVLPGAFSFDSNNELETSDSMISESSGSPTSAGALAWEMAQKAGADWLDDWGRSIAVDSNGDVYVTGTFNGQSTFGSTVLTSGGKEDIFIAKMNSTGAWLWALQAGGAKNDQGHDIAVDSSGNVFITGSFRSTANFGSQSMTAGPTGNDDLFVAKIDTWGNWLWVEGVDCHNAGRCAGASIDVDSSGYAYVTGSFARDMTFGSTTLSWAGVEDIFVAKIDTWGSWQWASMGGGAQGYDEPHSIAIGPNGNAFITGYFQFTATFDGPTGSNSLTMIGGSDVFIAKISQQGDWIWALSAGGNSTNVAHSIAVNPQGSVFVTGHFYSDVAFGNTSMNAGGVTNAFIAKAIDQGGSGAWDWAKQVSSSSSNSAEDLTLDPNGDLIVTGWFRGTASFGNSAITSSGNQDVFVAKFLNNGNCSWVQKAGSGSEDIGYGSITDTQGNLYVIGSFRQNTISFGGIDVGTSGGLDAFVAKMSFDYDQDNIPDVLDSDDDGDLILDIIDDCNPSAFGFQSVTTTDHDRDGCRDSDEDFDDDNDGILDENDTCPKGMIGWTPSNTTDVDMDGCLDAIEDYDDDADGIEDFLDLCPREFGNSTFAFEQGCPDSDGDGRADVKDPFPNDPTEWFDSDQDGIGDNSDSFPYDPTQNSDEDGDGYGDYPFGNFPDGCPDVFGTSVVDYFGCVDSDGDGVSDINDRFPNDPALWQDTDGDGYQDEIDAFPYNPAQWNDTDGDGFGDNPMDSSADRFVDDDTQWSDVDGDGYGDNPDGNMPDAFPLDPTQWMDSDGDGYGDNPSGSLPDAFPLDSTQWIDDDNDGLGDNPDGNNPDPHLFDSDNDGYNNSIDPLPLYPTPGDRDNDGKPDSTDKFPDDPTEWMDFDDDGIGDNEDIDDDNDNWDDWTEMREGTDPKNPYSFPVESFEIPITEDIALSAWDLLMLLAGLPLASWILFGLVTRNARTDAFEERMREAESRGELEVVATEYERALMVRLIGPHQGIRLERVRAELDDEIEMSEAVLTGEDEDFGPVVTSPDQTDYTEEELGMQPPEDADIVDDGKGYEWIEEGEDKWYRPVESSSWIKWET